MTVSRRSLLQGLAALAASAAPGSEPQAITPAGAPGAEPARGAQRALSPESFGAIGDGSLHPLSERFATLPAAQAVYPHAVSLADSIDWAAIQAAVDAAWEVGGGGEVHFSDAFYVLNRTVRLPADGERSLGLIGRGRTFFDINGAAPAHGNRIRAAQADGTDAFSALTTSFHKPHYFFRNFILIGPDKVLGTGPLRTTLASGNGIKVAGAGVAQVFMSQVMVYGFFGPGKAAIWMDNVEDSAFHDTRGESSDYGWRLSTAFNANVLVNCGAQGNKTHGFFLESGGLHMVGGLVQSNYGTGVHSAGSLHLDAVHFENNNMDGLPDQAAIVVRSTTVAGGATRCVACAFCTPRDYLLFKPLCPGFPGIYGVHLEDCVLQYAAASVEGSAVVFDDEGTGSTAASITIRNCRIKGYKAKGRTQVHGVTFETAGRLAFGGAQQLIIGGGPAQAQSAPAVEPPVFALTALLTATTLVSTTVAAGAHADFTVDVQGAAVGDAVAIGGAVDGHLIVTAQVPAPNVVRFTAYNPTTAQIAIKDRIFRAVVLRGTTHRY